MPAASDLSLLSPPSLQGEALTLFRRTRHFLSRLADGLLGLLTMIATLAVVSAIPLLNLLSLGYLLEASARVARSGRLRDGFPGIGTFAALGKVVIGVWLWTLPVRLIHSFWQDAELIQTGSKEADGLRSLLAFLIVMVALHLISALLRGGKLRHFLLPSPIRTLRWVTGREPLPRFRFSLLRKDLFSELMQLGRLGFFGFVGAAAWLVLPISILLLASGVENPGLSLLISLSGGLLLGLVVLVLPFLQTRYAMSRRFRDFFSPGQLRSLFRRAPLAFWTALSVTLLFALPLYLLKIELTPNEIAWLPNLIFVLFIFPARLLLGWAMSRAERGEKPRHWCARWVSGTAALPVAAAYVILVWLSQYLSWHGALSLLEQHAFLVPAPLLGI